MDVLVKESSGEQVVSKLTGSLYSFCACFWIIFFPYLIIKRYKVLPMAQFVMISSLLFVYFALEVYHLFDSNEIYFCVSYLLKKGSILLTLYCTVFSKNRLSEDLRQKFHLHITSLYFLLISALFICIVITTALLIMGRYSVPWNDTMGIIIIVSSAVLELILLVYSILQYVLLVRTTDSFQSSHVLYQLIIVLFAISVIREISMAVGTIMNESENISKDMLVTYKTSGWLYDSLYMGIVIMLSIIY